MIDVDICICTHGRTSLVETLISLASQDVQGARMRAIVADNDVHPHRRSETEALGAKLQLDIRYVHAPAHNISVARNACLDAADCDWIAFIDDDEVATPTWLTELLKARTGRDIVFGVSQATYGPDTAKWMRSGDFHSNRLKGRDQPWNGYTANVLINRQFCESRRLRFDPLMGKTGGEDTFFFYQANRAGARFGYAPDAVVTEFTEPSKASLRWLLLRRFRSGQTHEFILRKEGKSVSGALAAVAKVAWSISAAAVLSPWPSRAAAHLLRSAIHAGVVAGALGLSTYREFDHAGECETSAPSFGHMR
jgi:succinoglycan biosynthesis protein ExoM